MANKNFVVHNGLDVGPTTIDATSGNIRIPQGKQILVGNVILRDNGDGKLRVRDITDNSDVEIVATGYTGSSSYADISISPPVSEFNGKLWFDPETNVLSVFYNDGSSAQWVEAFPSVLVEDPVGTFTLDGNLVVNGTLYETSDARLKENITPILDPLTTISKLNGVEFDWVKTKQKSMGVIAQEIEQILPFLVNESADGIKSVNYMAMIGLLIECIKELNERLK